MSTYNKLVRDLIPDILDRKGVIYEKRIADQDEFKTELIKKLQEEVGEFIEAQNCEELADVLEVIDALISLPEFTDTHLIKKTKNQEKGGFSQRIILKGEK